MNIWSSLALGVAQELVPVAVAVAGGVIATVAVKVGKVTREKYNVETEQLIVAALHGAIGRIVDAFLAAGDNPATVVAKTVKAVQQSNPKGAQVAGAVLVDLVKRAVAAKTGAKL